MVTASGVSQTIFLSSDLDELCDRLKLLLQEKHAGNNSDIINDEIVSIVDKLLEYKCITKKQHKQILIKCNLLENKHTYSYKCVHKYNYMYTFLIYKCINSVKIMK